MVFCKNCKHYSRLSVECQHKECFVECDFPISGRKSVRITQGKNYVGCYTLNKNCDCKYFEPIEQKPWWKFWVK